VWEIWCRGDQALALAAEPGLMITSAGKVIE
jgi:hypothetical protein